MKNNNKQKKQRSRLRWLFAPVAVVLFFALIEGALALMGFRYDPFMKAPKWWVRFEGQPIYLVHPLRFWQLRPLSNATRPIESPDTQFVNSLGFRDEEFDKKKVDGELRVIALGDSCTFGDGVADWATYSNVLERNLKHDMDRKVTVINAGVPGYTSYQCLSYLQYDLLAYKPDLVTIYVGLNDNIPADNSVPDSARKPNLPEVYAHYQSLRKLRFVQGIEYLIGKYLRPVGTQKISTKEGHNTYRVPMDEYVQNLCAIKKLGDEKGFKVIVMTIPHVFEQESERNKMVRQAAADCGIPMIDLFAELKKLQAQGENHYEADGGHPNTLGHRRIAWLIQRKMHELGMAPEPLPITVEPSGEPIPVPDAPAKEF